MLEKVGKWVKINGEAVLCIAINDYDTVTYRDIHFY